MYLPVHIINSIFFIFSTAQSCSQPESEVDFSDVSVKNSDVDGQQRCPLQLSSNIKCVVFPRGDITRFKPAR